MRGAPHLFEDPPAEAPAIILRPYQEKATQATRAAYDRGVNRALIVMPTGTGKTTFFSKLVGDFHALGQRSIVLAHRVELLEQAADRIAAQNPHLRVGIEGGDVSASGWCNSVVAGVQSIGRPNSKRLPRYNAGLLVIDEAHHAVADSYQAVMRRFGSYDGRCFTVGVTATPHRMKNHPDHPLHGTDSAVFEEIVFQFTLREAIDQHYLADLRGYRVKTSTDLSSVKTTAGDYNQKALADAVNTQLRNEEALKHWQEVAAARRTIVFCAGVDHAKDVAAMFCEAGVSAESVDGATKREVREAIIKRFKSGETQVLTNVDIATEGFDAPEVSCVLMLRPTQSWPLFVQMVGRGLRLSAGKIDCIVIDVVDNSAKLSMIGVPAMLGLPPQMDLQGASLKEVAGTFDKLNELQKAIIFKKPAPKMSDLSTELTSVDLLGELSLPDDIAGVATLAWLKVGDDSYLLDLGDAGRAHLRADALGVWLSHIEPKGAAVMSRAVGDDRTEAFNQAEADIRLVFPDACKLALGAKWRGDTASEKQKDLMAELGIEPELISRVTRGQASQLITARMQQRKMRQTLRAA